MFTPETHILSFSFCNPPLSRYKATENGKSPNSIYWNDLDV